MHITVLAEGSTRWQRFVRHWGVSFLVDGDVLFDAFGHSAVFGRNVRRYGVDLGRLRHIVISHDDWDHIAGLGRVLERHKAATVYICPDAQPAFKAWLASYGVRVVETAPFLEIKEGIATTGPMTGIAKEKPVTEQALVLKTAQGLVIVTGCAHPGIVPIVERVKERFKEDIRLVLGGLHMKAMPPDDIDRVVTSLQALGVKGVAPLHCTGRRAVRAFTAAFGDRCLRLRPGVPLPL